MKIIKMEKNNDWRRGFSSWNEWSTRQHCVRDVASNGVRAIVVRVREGTVVVL